MSKEIFEMAFNSIVEMDSQMAMKALDEAAAAGVSFVDVLNEGFAKGLEEFGEQFSMGDVFLPDLIVAAKVMSEAAARIEKDMVEKGVAIKKKGKFLMATVQGDVHDIGKGIVCTMLRAGGVEVIDMGRDVSVERIIEAAEANEVDIIGTSTLLTMCMEEQKLLEDALREKGIRDKYKTMVGGAPVTAKWAKRIGADFYANDASDGVKLATKVLEEKYA